MRTARMAMMVFRAVQVLTALPGLMVKMVRMALMVSAVMWALQVLPARKVHRVNGVSAATPVRTDPMVKTVMMGARWCPCTVLRVAWL